jgi:tetratricopeptide (TPR) repeat protein
VVVRLGEHNEKLPEANTPVRLYGHGNPTHTDSHGAFRLTLPDIFKAGEKVTLEVDKPGWRIHYPLEGETRVPADLAKGVVEVRLAPKGSGVFLTHEALEKFILGLSEKAKRLEEVKQKEQQLTEEIVRDYRLAGAAHYSNYAFDSALYAYQQAQYFASREQMPTLWAATMVDIGRANDELGIRASGSAIHSYLSAAVQVYQQALEVYTREHLPQRWAQTHNNLARTYVALEDWPNAAASYANVLQIYPDYTEAYEAANRLYHEVLFRFPEAFALNQQWLERHPEDWSALSTFAENHFTTGRFSECAERLATLLANPEIEPRMQVALQAIVIANLLARNQGELVPGTIDTLLERIAAQPEDFRVGWAFAGTRHFIGQHPSLASHRAWLQQFFDMVEGQDRQTILAGLQAVRAAFAPGGKQ